MKQTKTLYDFDNEFEELMDQAVNDLSPKQFTKFLDDISMMLTDYEDGQVANDGQRNSNKNL